VGETDGGRGVSGGGGGHEGVGAMWGATASETLVLVCCVRMGVVSQRVRVCECGVCGRGI
jgi:hypothetical protein